MVCWRVWHFCDFSAETKDTIVIRTKYPPFFLICLTNVFQRKKNVRVSHQNFDIVHFEYKTMHFHVDNTEAFMQSMNACNEIDILSFLQIQVTTSGAISRVANCSRVRPTMAQVISETVFESLSTQWQDPYC